jgi:hypothetical protein
LNEAAAADRSDEDFAFGLARILDSFERLVRDFRRPRAAGGLASASALSFRAQIQGRREMSVHAQLLEALADGEWHSEADLLPITPFPREWMTELCHDGHEVVEGPSGMQVVRLKQEPAIPQ